MLRRKKLALLVGVVTLIVVLAANVGAAKKTKLVIFFGWNQVNFDDPNDTRATLIKDFEKAYPDIDISIVQAPVADMGAMQQKVTSMLNAGEQIDIINDVSGGQYWEYQEDLTPYIKKDKDIKNWKYNIKDIWDYVTSYKGKQAKILNLPGQIGLTLCWFNKKLLAEAGLPFPPRGYRDKGEPGKRLSYEEWTTDKYAEYAQKLTKYDPNGVPLQLGCFEGGHQTGTWQLTFLGPTIVGKDYEVTKRVGKQNWVIGTNYSDPGYVKLIQWLVDLEWKYNAIGKDPDIYRKGIDFPQGNVALRILPSWFNATCRATVKDLGDYYDIAPVPHLPGYQTMSDAVPWAATGWMNNRSKVKNAAWTFLKWQASPERQEKFYIDGTWAGAPGFTKEMIPKGYQALLNAKTPANVDFLFEAQERAYLKPKRKPNDWNESGWWDETGKVWADIRTRKIGVVEGLKKIDEIGKRHYDEGWAIEPK